MKRYLLFLIMVIASCFSAHAQKLPASSAGSSEVIELKEAAFDFGKIPQGRPVTHNFELVNKGKTPLSLENVQASCGCTTPEWSQLPIGAGTSSVIKVGFNAASEGHFSKTITISYNSGQVKTFMITGDVYPAPTTSAPLNTSLSLLK